MRIVIVFLLLAICATLVAGALPPSPPTVIYGTVTDSYTNPLPNTLVTAKWTNEAGGTTVATTRTFAKAQGSFNAGDFVFRDITAPEHTTIKIVAQGGTITEIASAPGGQALSMSIIVPVQPAQGSTTAQPKSTPQPLSNPQSQPTTQSIQPTSYQTSTSGNANQGNTPQGAANSQQGADNPQQGNTQQDSPNQANTGNTQQAGNRQGNTQSNSAGQTKQTTPQKNTNSTQNHSTSESISSSKLSMPAMPLGNPPMPPQKKSWFTRLFSWLSQSNEENTTAKLKTEKTSIGQLQKKPTPIALKIIVVTIILSGAAFLAFKVMMFLKSYSEQVDTIRSARKIATTYIQDIMRTTVQTVEKKEFLAVAVKKMKAQNIHSMCVLDSKQLAGILTDNDILFNSDELSAQTVEDVMSDKVITIKPDAYFYELTPMISSHIRKVPILRDGMLVGIITTADMASHLVTLENKETSFPKISKVMNKSVIAVDASNKVKDVLKLMREAQQDCIVIHRQGLHVGTFSSRDYLKALPSIDVEKKIGELMESPINGVEDLEIIEALETMVATGTNKLFVTKNNKVIGIVTEASLVSEMNNFVMSMLPRRIRKKIGV